MASKKNNSAPSLSIHYPMQAFGSLLDHIEKIRVTYLENRLVPLVPFPHKHDFFQILILTKGSGWHEIDFQRHQVSADSVFIIKPSQMHDWELSPDTEGMVIEFELGAVRGTLQSFDSLTDILFKLPDSIVYNFEEKRNLTELCERIENELLEKQVGYETLACFKLTELLISIYRYLPQSEIQSSKHDESVNRFLNLLEENYTQQHQVEFYAQELGLTAKTFSMRVVRALGQSPKEIIHNRCALEAQRLLGYSNKSINQIGEMLGFEDPSYFARFFKKVTGVSPAAFRKKTRENRQQSNVLAAHLNRVVNIEE